MSFSLTCWTVWNGRNAIVFRDEVLSIQRLKSFFVHLFWLETKVSLVDGPMTLVHFIDSAEAFLVCFLRCFAFFFWVSLVRG